MRYKSKKKLLYIIFFAFGIVGIISGTLFANYINYTKYPEFMGIFENLNIKLELFDRKFGIINTFISYGCIIFVVWIFGFTSISVYSSIIIIIIDGFIYGYIMSNFFIKYSFRGILFFSILYLIEGLIFLPILFKILYMSIQYSVSRHNYFNIFRETKKYIQLNTYIIELLFAFIIVFLISLVDTYLVALLYDL